MLLRLTLLTMFLVVSCHSQTMKEFYAMLPSCHTATCRQNTTTRSTTRSCWQLSVPLKNSEQSLKNLQNLSK